MLRTPAPLPVRGGGSRSPIAGRVRRGPEFGRPHRRNLHLFCYICRTWKAFRTNQETNFRFAARLSLYLPYETSDNHTDTARRDALRRSAGSDLPTPDAKTLGMGGVAMTTLSGSHAIYNNSATAIFSQMPSQISSSYYGQGQFDYYAVTGFCRFDNVNPGADRLAAVPARAGQQRHGGRSGYSRRIGGNWAVGVVARYMHLKRPETSADALAVDLSAAWSHPLENVGSYSTLRAGAKLGNLGGYLKDTPYTLPMDLTAGVALDTFLSDVHEITVGTDLGYYFSPSKVRGFQMSVGAEYNLMQLIQLRAGYHYGERRDYYPSYGSVGAGVRFLHLRLDFAYLIAKKQTLLHNTYSISFGLDF